MKLANLAVAARMRLLIGMMLLGLSALCAVSLTSLRTTMIEDRKVQTRHQVESGASILKHFHALAQAGSLSEADARKAATEALRTVRYDGNNYLFVVGTDIEPGTYASAGPVENGTCYWKRMADLHGGDIIDNAFTKKPQAVTIDATDKAFKTSGCQPWLKTDAVAGQTPATGVIPALTAQAQLRAWLEQMNTNARQFDGSQVPVG